MFGLASLDVLVGLITVYLVFSLACTAIVEAVSAWTSLRSKKLETALNELFAGYLADGRLFVDAFFDHPLVQALSKGQNGRPSYIPPDIVGKVVQSLVMDNAQMTSLRDAVAALPDDLNQNRIKGLLSALIAYGGEDPAAFRNSVETQFDAVMDRASGWVKRRQQMVSLIVSTVLVVAANVDTFSFATILSSSPELRAKMLDSAEYFLANDAAVAETEDEVNAGREGVVPDGTETTSGETGLNKSLAAVLNVHPSQPISNNSIQTKEADHKGVDGNSLHEAKLKLQKAAEAYAQARIGLEETGLKFGWNSFPKANEWITKISGLLISIFAISLGAPFWFDILKKFMQIRQAGASPREKKA